MRDVVVIGGGLSGLAAAHELEKQNVPYTLIEVKPRLGGSIMTVQQDGFTFDTGPFAIEKLDSLGELGLEDELVQLPGGAYGFKSGTQTLIDALAKPLTGSMMMQMAVSSIGELDGAYTVCLENGLMLNARAVIVAIPARYAERLFYGYITEVSQRLMGYRYDAIQRISVGFSADAVKLPMENPPDMAYVSIQGTDSPTRAPEGHVMVQMCIRVDPFRCEEIDLVSCIVGDLSFGNPISQRVDFWSEADPLSCFDDDHAQTMAEIREMLPDGVALIGSDYLLTPPVHRGIARLDERIRQGRAAAQQIATKIRA